MKIKGYKLRKLNGADRYGQFKEGRQQSADWICGSQVWHKFSNPVNKAAAE